MYPELLCWTIWSEYSGLSIFVDACDCCDKIIWDSVCLQNFQHHATVYHVKDLLEGNILSTVYDYGQTLPVLCLHAPLSVTNT